MKNLFEISNNEIELTKSNVSVFADMIIKTSDDGHVDVLTLLARIEFISQVIDQAKDKLKENAVDELALYGPESKSGVKMHGVTFKVMESGVKYDFTETQYWNDLKSAETKTTDTRKEFETLLKTIKKATQIAIPDTGEMIDLIPPIKSSKTTMSISLPK